MSTMLRTGQKADLPDINAVIERAVMAWRLPERVKRLSLPLHQKKNPAQGGVPGICFRQTDLTRA